MLAGKLSQHLSSSSVDNNNNSPLSSSSSGAKAYRTEALPISQKSAYLSPRRPSRKTLLPPHRASSQLVRPLIYTRTLLATRYLPPSPHIDRSCRSKPTTVSNHLAPGDLHRGRRLTHQRPSRSTSRPPSTTCSSSGGRLTLSRLSRSCPRAAPSSPSSTAPPSLPVFPTTATCSLVPSR